MLLQELIESEAYLNWHKKVKALEQGFHVKKSKSHEKNQLLPAHGFPLKILLIKVQNLRAIHH